MKRVIELAIGWGQVAIGAVLVVAGIVLSLPFVPGPGFLLVFIGVIMISPYHGKRAIARIRLWYRQAKAALFNLPHA